MNNLDKKTKVFIWILLIWGGMFFIDMLSIHYIFNAPIFMIPFAGGEVVTYVGLGYMMMEYFPFTDEQVSISPDLFIMPFIICYSFATLLIIITIIKRFRKTILFELKWLFRKRSYKRYRRRRG